MYVTGKTMILISPYDKKTLNIYTYVIISSSTKKSLHRHILDKTLHSNTDNEVTLNNTENTKGHSIPFQRLVLFLKGVLFN